VANATAEKAKSALDTLPAEAYYHIGMLPATKPVEFPIPTRDKQANGQYHTSSTVDPWELWNNAAGMEEGLSIFVSKARQFNSIGVRGMVFNTVSEGIEAVGGNLTRSPFPGEVKLLRADEVRAIVRSCWKHFIRYQFAASGSDKLNQRVEIKDFDHNRQPANMTKDQWDQYRVSHAVEDSADFNPRTDKYVAEFVYIVPLLDAQGNPKMPYAPGDEVGYEKNPNKYNARTVGSVTKAFFSEEGRPRSVSEMYPQGA